MVDHYPLLSFLDSASLDSRPRIEDRFCLHAKNDGFMLCSFGTSTEASAPAVLSLYNSDAAKVLNYKIIDIYTMQCRLVRSCVL